MKALLSLSGSSLILAIAAVTAPQCAASESYVPPGNSAATQYTEALPTAGGPKATGKSKHRSPSAPGEVLGAHNAHKLDAKGPTGRTVAAIAAETAPASAGAAAEAAQRSSPGQRPGGAGAGGPSDAGSSPARDGTPQAHPHPYAPAKDAKGSSGIGAVLAAASGSPSGDAGLLLPLVLLGTAAWAIYYLLRQRRRPAG